MADTNTTYLGLTKVEVGASGDTWGTKINANADAVDALFGTGPALLVSKGGTGAITAAAARTNLGVAIGSNVQAWDADLDAIAALAGTSGLLRKTAANTWSLETTAYAPLAAPTFTGVPAAPTAAADTNTTQLATTAFVVAQASSTTPAANGTAAVGTSLRYARADHVHPSDTSLAPLASPTFTGKVTTAASAIGGAGFRAPHGAAPTTPVNGDIWTTTTGLFAYINGATIQTAPLASPTFTGTPAAPTAAVDTNTTQVATTAYVVGQGYLKSATASSTYAPLASPALTGTPTAPTAAVNTNTTQLATTAYVVGQGYLTSASASATYLTSASASSTYLTISSASSTYATQATVSGIVSATTANVLNSTAGASAGGVGTYAFMLWATVGSTQPEGTTVAGSSLTFTMNNAGTGGNAGAGTWRLMGRVTATNSASVFLRIA